MCLRIVISHATTPFRIVLFLLDSWQHHGCCEVSQVFFGIQQNSMNLGFHTRYLTYKSYHAVTYLKQLEDQ